MDRVFADVLDFHKAMCPEQIQARPNDVNDKVYRLREKLIDEEYVELNNGMRRDNLPEIADAIADLIYVSVGTAIAYGIDLRPIWKAIHAANMQKANGPRRADGKVQKPPGWTHPDIAAILTNQEPINLE